MISDMSIARALALAIVIGTSCPVYADDERVYDVGPAQKVSRAPKSPVVAKSDMYLEWGVCPSLDEPKRGKILLTQASASHTR